jgi:primary-amine oxidase
MTTEEIAAATGILKSLPEFPAEGRFSIVTLKEPSKEEVLGFKPGSPILRQAFAVVLDRAGSRTFEAVVDITGKRAVSFNEVKGAQPLILEGEYETISRIVKGNPEWQQAMRKRGIEDFAKVQIDGWAAGQVGGAHSNARLMRAVSYFKGDQVNFYGRPIEGVVALVNMNTERVIEVTDSPVVPLPPPSQEFDEKSTGTREAPKRLSIQQPDGASFQINGHEVQWQKWRFRYAMHPREGLVLYTIGYEDEGNLRPIFYRAALSEMVVPYGDSDQNWRWRAAFDVGEYSVGRLASQIEPGTDAPENATLLDATLADDAGNPKPMKNAVGIYERDGGLLWKHYDAYSGKNQSRRARQLVIFFIATVGNYDYAINWVFHQDGTLELDAALTGIMLPNGVAETAVSGHGGRFKSGHLVAPNVVAPHHQHFFNFRLDFDVDGQNNSVQELNTRAQPPGNDNPSLTGMVMEEAPLQTEKKAQRPMDMQNARHWQVFNSSVTNALGYPSSYILVPGPNSVPYVAASSQLRRRAGFINSHFWVTRYNVAEMNAAGDYPNQSQGGDGLPRWVTNDESLVNQDLVLWYTFGITHIPRPEEWPVMGVTHVGFRMIPAGFFPRNPGLDVPR